MLLRSFLIALLTTPLAAQTPASPALIDQLVANAQTYSATLPSLTADEAITSENSFMGMFPDHAKTTGTFRVIRRTQGGPLEESRIIAVYNGKPVAPDHHQQLPSTLTGGFGRFDEMFFTPQHRLCYDFLQLPEPGPGGTLQIAITVHPSTPPDPTCAGTPAGVTGLARIDPATHHLLHIERTVPEPAASKMRLAPFSSVDCAATKVGEETFWLPTTITACISNGKLRGQFTAHYTNYHRYHATITLLPGATEVPPEPTPPPKQE